MDRRYILRVGVLTVLKSLVLCFLVALALASVTGSELRFPWYLIIPVSCYSFFRGVDADCRRRSQSAQESSQSRPPSE